MQKSDRGSKCISDISRQTAKGLAAISLAAKGWVAKGLAANKKRWKISYGVIKTKWTRNVSSKH